MSYRYITADNLENSQTYMYSEYGGEEFLCEYFETRDMTGGDVGVNITKLVHEYVGQEAAAGNLKKLLGAYAAVKNGNIGEQEHKDVEFFIKVFELRKRIYNEYMPNSYRPVESSGYDGLKNYILLGLILVELYEKTENLKYLNTLLKLNDTLLSVKGRMNGDALTIVSYLATREVGFIKSLCIANLDMEIGC